MSTVVRSEKYEYNVFSTQSILTDNMVKNKTRQTSTSTELPYASTLQYKSKNEMKGTKITGLPPRGHLFEIHSTPFLKQLDELNKQETMQQQNNTCKDLS